MNMKKHFGRKDMQKEAQYVKVDFDLLRQHTKVYPGVSPHGSVYKHDPYPLTESRELKQANFLNGCSFWE